MKQFSLTGKKTNLLCGENQSHSYIHHKYFYTHFFGKQEHFVLTTLDNLLHINRQYIFFK